MNVNSIHRVVEIIVALIIIAVVVFASTGNIGVDNSDSDVADTCLNAIPYTFVVNDLLNNLEADYLNVGANVREYNCTEYHPGINPEAIFPIGPFEVSI